MVVTHLLPLASRGIMFDHNANGPLAPIWHNLSIITFQVYAAIHPVAQQWIRQTLPRNRMEIELGDLDAKVSPTKPLSLGLGFHGIAFLIPRSRRLLGIWGLIDARVPWFFSSRLGVRGRTSIHRSTACPSGLWLWGCMLGILWGMHSCFLSRIRFLWGRRRRGIQDHNLLGKSGIHDLRGSRSLESILQGTWTGILQGVPTLDLLY